MTQQHATHVVLGFRPAKRSLRPRQQVAQMCLDRQRLFSEEEVDFLRHVRTGVKLKHSEQRRLAALGSVVVRSIGYETDMEPSPLADLVCRAVHSLREGGGQ